MKRLGSITITVALAAGLVLAACDQGSSSSGGGDTDNVMLSAKLSSQFEVPEVTVASDALGTGTVTLDKNSGNLSGSVTVEGLTGEVTGAHVHEGAAGIAGGVVVGLEQDSSNAMQWNIPAGTELSAENQAKLLNGEMYFNVHTEANPAGEIRGQILADGFSVHRFDLSGDNEVPPVSSDGKGVGFLTLNENTSTAYANISLMGIDDATDAHIHSGFAGENGPVVAGFTSSDNEFWELTGSAQMLSEMDLELLMEGGLYVNVHTTTMPSGELRAQITPDHIEVSHFELNGHNEVPPVETEASGMGYATINHLNQSVVIKINLMDLTGGSAAHIHEGFAGANGSVLSHLEADFAEGFIETSSAVMLEADDFESLINGGLYINVHTGANPDGELRGQITPMNIGVARAELGGEFEVPSVMTAAKGTGYVTFNSDTGVIVMNLMTMDLSSTATAAHLHHAPAGENGPVVIGLEQDISDASVWSETGTLTDAQLDLLMSGELYFNVHTGNFAGGEIRGQALIEGVQVARFELNGDNEVPPVDTMASGIGYATINTHDQSIIVKVSVMDLADANAAHLHSGFAGANGGVVIGLDTADNLFFETETAVLLDDADFGMLLQGGHYINVHSATHADGEVRGQIAPEGIVVVRTALSGDQEVPPVDPAGTGIGYTTVNSHSGSIMVNLMTADLTSAADAAHIHEAPAGENGPVVLGLEQNAMDMNQWHAPAGSMLDSDGLAAFFAGNLYFNVHTVDNPSGEVRGQIEP